MRTTVRTRFPLPVCDGLVSSLIFCILPGLGNAGEGATWCLKSRRCSRLTVFTPRSCRKLVAGAGVTSRHVTLPVCITSTPRALATSSACEGAAHVAADLSSFIFSAVSRRAREDYTILSLKSVSSPISDTQPDGFPSDLRLEYTASGCTFHSLSCSRRLYPI